jgi:hypothetical protein
MDTVEQSSTCYGVITHQRALEKHNRGKEQCERAMEVVATAQLLHLVEEWSL